MKHYVENKYFERNDQYNLRKAYINFIWKLYHVSLEFDDLHWENIMYDETNHRMEIIDGSASISTEKKLDFKRGSIIGLTLDKLFQLLESITRHNTRYSKKIDKTVLEQLHLKDDPKEFHATPDNTSINYSFSKFAVDFCWKKNNYPKNFINTTRIATFEKDQRTELQEIVDSILYRHNTL